MTNVVVTGGSGKAGRAVVRHLLEHGHKVLNVDLAPSPDPVCHFLKADLTDFGQAIDSLRVAAGVMDRRRPFRDAEAVVHLAAIPSTGLVPDALTFATNMRATYNVFSAATLFGLRRVVWASSETVYGLPYTRVLPDRAPIAEDHALRPETGYALSKVLGERMASEMHRWNPGTSFIGLRLSNVMDPEDYAAFPSFTAEARKFNLWGYVDGRDVGEACRLAIESGFTGADAFNIAAADTVMTKPSRALLAEVFPTVPVTGALGEFQGLLSVEKAGKAFGFRPCHSWRGTR
ncbi:MAG: NAD(P)-dependent oxidoreductase [Alphaproteobacteria bacterium]